MTYITSANLGVKIVLSTVAVLTKLNINAYFFTMNQSPIVTIAKDSSFPLNQIT